MWACGLSSKVRSTRWRCSRPNQDDRLTWRHVALKGGNSRFASDASAAESGAREVGGGRCDQAPDGCRSATRPCRARKTEPAAQQPGFDQSSCIASRAYLLRIERVDCRVMRTLSVLGPRVSSAVMVGATPALLRWSRRGSTRPGPWTQSGPAASTEVYPALYRTQVRPIARCRDDPESRPRDA